jgi:hypothetical protein
MPDDKCKNFFAMSILKLKRFKVSSLRARSRLQLPALRWDPWPQWEVLIELRPCRFFPSNKHWRRVYRHLNHCLTMYLSLFHSPSRDRNASSHVRHPRHTHACMQSEKFQVAIATLAGRLWDGPGRLFTFQAQLPVANTNTKIKLAVLSSAAQN